MATITAVFALFFCCSASRESTLSLAFCFLESDVVMVYFESRLSSWIVLSFILRTIITLKNKSIYFNDHDICENKILSIPEKSKNRLAFVREHD